MSRPDLARDPEGWERSWQMEIDRRLSKLPTMSLFSVMNGSSAGMMMTEDGYQVLALAHKVCA
jgi:RIO-like serine/threonine protein kinase